MMPSLPRNTSLPLSVRAVFLNIYFLFKCLEQAPWLGRRDTLLITSYFTQWQGSVSCRALALPHARLCSETPLPLLSSVPSPPLPSPLLPPVPEGMAEPNRHPPAPEGLSPPDPLGMPVLGVTPGASTHAM